MATFYISPDGSDAYTSTQAQSSLTPWVHPPGDMVTNNSSNCAAYTATTNDVLLFERDSVWINQDTIKVVGYDNLTFGAYGTGEDPIWQSGDDYTGKTWTRDGTTNNYSADQAERHGRLILSPVTATGGFDSGGNTMGMAAPAGRPLTVGWVNSTLDDDPNFNGVITGVSRTWKKTGITTKPWKLAGSLGTTGGGGWDDSRSEDTANGTPTDTDSSSWPPIGKWSYNATNDELYVTVDIGNTINFNSPASDDDGIYIIYDLSDTYPWYYEDFKDGVEVNKIWVLGDGTTNPGSHWDIISCYKSTGDWDSHPTVQAFGNTTWPFTQKRNCMAITDSDNLEISDISFRGGLANSITVLNNNDAGASNVTNIYIHDISVYWVHGENMITLMGLSSTLQMTNIHVEDVLVDRGTLAAEELGYETGGGDNLWIYGGIKDSWMKRVISRGCTHTHIDIENDYAVSSTAMDNILVEDLTVYRDNSWYCRPYQTGLNGTNDTHMKDVVIRRLNTFYGDINVNSHTSGANVTLEFSIIKTDKHPDYGSRSHGLDIRGYVNKTDITPNTHITARNITLRNNLILYAGESGIFVVHGGDNSYPFEGTMEIYNNIIYEWNQEGAAANVNNAIHDSRASTAIDTSIFNLHHNCIYQAAGDDPIEWRTAAGGTTSYATVAAAEAAEDEIWDNVEGDPKFVNPSKTSDAVHRDFALAGDSPCLLEGYPYTGWDSAVDFASAPINNVSPDMGTFWSNTYEADVVVAVKSYTLPALSTNDIPITTDKLNGKTPKGCIAFVTAATSTGTIDSEASWSVGFASSNVAGSGDYAIAGHSNDGVVGSSDTDRYGSTTLGRVYVGAGLDSYINFDNFIQNGIQIDFVKTNADSFHVVFVFFAGDDVETSHSVWSLPGTTTKTAYTFGATNDVRPDLLFLAHVGRALTSSNSFAIGGYGVCTSQNKVIDNQQCIGYRLQDLNATSSAWMHTLTDKAIAKTGTSTAVVYTGVVSDIDNDGASITQAGTPAADDVVAFGVQMKGVQTWSDIISAPTSTGEQAYTGVGFLPQFLGLIPTNFLTADLDTGTFSGDDCVAFGFGAADSADQYVQSIHHEDGASTSNTGQLYDTTIARLPLADGTESTSTSIDTAVHSFNEDGFTLDYTGTNTTNAFNMIAYGIQKALSAKNAVGNTINRCSGPFIARGKK
jgi:hypothetical protein